MCKKVQFSCDIEFISTFANEDYDRTAQEVAKLTYKDMLELLTMKSQWRRDMERMMQERAAREKTQTGSNSDSSNNNNECHFSNVMEICI